MRKREKDRLLEMIDTLAGGCREAVQLIEGSKEEDAISLLTDCQEAAIAVGNAIEQAEGTGTGAVALLEELCELIYCCVSHIPTGKREEGKVIGGQIEIKGAQVRDKFIHDIKEEKMAVFLPYKVSMWDSLESVWKASCKEGDWISIVMPIPYFDKKPDGTLGEMQ